MKVSKISNWIGDKTDLKIYRNYVETDLKNLFLALQGRIRFGTPTDGNRGENISGEFQIFTSVATNSGPTVVSHGLSGTPLGWITISKNLGGTLFLSASSLTTITFVSTTTTTTYTIFLLK